MPKNKDGIVVLSLFDGMSCGQIALERAGIKVRKYYASEIDKWAIKITQKNYPQTIQLGDITKWQEWDIETPDLIIAGSPCQGFSVAGYGLNFDDPRSKLFFTFCDILAHYSPKNPKLKYLLENVRMKKEWQEIITDRMKVSPVLINSALVSAQSRQRLYWANWEFPIPEDKGILLKDIIENGDVDRDKSYAIDANYFKGGSSEYLARMKSKSKRQSVIVQGAAIRNQVTKHGVEEQLNIRKDGKSNAVVPSYPSKLNGVVTEPIQVGSIYPSGGLAGRIYSPDGKSPSLRTASGGNHMPKVSTDTTHYRKLTCLECERLQTVPERYTEGVSDTQRYKMLGNGWTIDVIAHIFSYME